MKTKKKTPAKKSSNTTSKKKATSTSKKSAAPAKKTAATARKTAVTTSRKVAAKKTAAARKTVTAKKTTPAKKKMTAKEENKKFPGYPKYSPKEDIMEQGTRLDQNLDDEVLTELKNGSDLKLNTVSAVKEKNYTISTESDLTDEDREALGPKDLSMDMGEDEELLKHRDRPVDFAGKDLDIPGSELDDDQESIGSEDEENNLYSQGGDDKENLEERQD